MFLFDQFSEDSVVQKGMAFLWKQVSCLHGLLFSHFEVFALKIEGGSDHASLPLNYLGRLILGKRIPFVVDCFVLLERHVVESWSVTFYLQGYVIYQLALVSLLSPNRAPKDELVANADFPNTFQPFLGPEAV